MSVVHAGTSWLAEHFLRSMKPFSFIPRTSPLRGAVLLAGLIPTLAAQAQTIPNPSFETDSYVVWPGYSNSNGGVISGWTSAVPGSVGLNPASGSPFADNGTVPAGTNVAFLQSTAGGTDLGTTISGLTAGTTYRVYFRANARAGQSPSLKVRIDGAPVNVSIDFNAPVADALPTSVNSLNPYHYVSFEFTAGGALAGLTLLNDAAGDTTVCVDDFSIGLASAPLSTGIVATRWTGDADSGIDSQYRYTHAHTFGAALTSVTANSVVFSPAAGANPNVLDHMTWGGFGNLFGEQTRAISGNSNLVAKSFMYGGPTMSVQIKGLKPNTTYVATIYGVGWEDGTRAADFSGTAGGGPSNVNLDAYGVTNGITVRYRYTTDGAGSPVTLNYAQAAGAGSFHTAAFSNREATPGTSPNTWTTAPWSNDATSGVNEGGTFLYTHAYNLNSATNAVINGVTFIGKTGGNPSAANFAMTGFGTGYVNDANNVMDVTGSRAMANDFLYNGFPGALTLTGLTPGTEYQLTLFSVGWEDAGRVANFVGYNQVGAVIDQDTYLNDNGIRINYVYTAPASGSISITTNPLATGSIHLYGFANRKTAPETALAVTSQPQDAFVNLVGDTAVFTATASGSLPLTYEWRKNGTPISGQTGTTNLSATLTIAGVTAADVADYTVAFTGSGGQGTVVSNPAHLYLITDPVPGLFDTGLGSNCAVLPDGGLDAHYYLMVNPDGAPLVPGVVQDSTTFPIVAGPWLANTALSKWIGPQFNTSGSQGDPTDVGAGPGVYVYRTTFDLTGFDLNTVRITGNWATDNEGVDIRVNGVSTGITNVAQFINLTPFLLSSGNATFTTGVNFLEFRVRNASLGYTGLRVEGMKGFGTILPGTVPYIVTQPVDTVIPWNTSNTLCVSAAGSAMLNYQWNLNNAPIPGATSSMLTITANDCNLAGTYTVTITNSAGSVTSNPAVVTLTNVPPCPGPASLGLDLGISGKLTVASLVSGATGGSGPVTFSGVQAGPTAGGGTVSVVDGWVVYQPAPGFVGADSFTYTLSDGSQTGTGTVTVVVAQGIGQTFNIIGMTPEGAGKRLVGLGIPGRLYQWQYSSDLASWTGLVAPSICPSSGVLTVLDPGPVLPPSRFYRLVQVTAP